MTMLLTMIDNQDMPALMASGSGLDNSQVRSLTQTIERLKREREEGEAHKGKLTQQLMAMRQEKASWRLQQLQLTEECERLRREINDFKARG